MCKRTLKPSKHSISDDDIIKEALKRLKKRFRRGKVITKPEETIDYLQLKLAEREYEVFCVMFLDNRHRVLCFEELFRGTVDSSHVYPREIVKLALQHNAAAVILAHNHPSGSAEPSVADRQITQCIKSALELVDIRVLDHIVIGVMETVSLAERGLMDTGKGDIS
tara:strand:- start:1368 stop:1865 length:498 start_codon:yes stop_codon:yes gene_type:complete